MTMRFRFFTHPMVRFLWTKFINESPKTLYEYLENVKTDEHEGPLKFKIIIDEIDKIEDVSKFTIIPKSIRHLSNPKLGRRTHRKTF